MVDLTKLISAQGAVNEGSDQIDWKLNHGGKFLVKSLYGKINCANLL